MCWILIIWIFAIRNNEPILLSTSNSITCGARWIYRRFLSFFHYFLNIIVVEYKHVQSICWNIIVPFVHISANCAGRRHFGVARKLNKAVNILESAVSLLLFAIFSLKIYIGKVIPPYKYEKHKIVLIVDW